MSSVENTTPIANNQTLTVGDGLTGFTDSTTTLPTTFVNGDALTVIGTDPEGFARLSVSGTTTLSGLMLQQLQTLLIQGSPLVLQGGNTFGAEDQTLIFTNAVSATGDVSFQGFPNFDGAASFSARITLNDGGGGFFGGTFGDIVGGAGTRLVFGTVTVNGTISARGSVEVLAGEVLSAAVIVDRGRLLVQGTYNGPSVTGTGSDKVEVESGGLLESDLDLGNFHDTVLVQGDLSGTVRMGTGQDRVTLDDPGARLEGNVFGQKGNDTVEVRSGVLDGGVNTGLGDDSVEVQAGGSVLERVNMSVGKDVLLNDGFIGGRVLMGGGNDSVSGNGTFADLILLGGGDDTATTGDGNDSVRGGAGKDRIVTRGGDDLLEGGAGSDTLIGGAGSDTLIGDAGRDILIGGSGADVFQFAPGTSDIHRDVIRDFEQGVDVMDFGNDVNAFIGAAPFSGTPGEIHVRETDEGSIVFVDYDGDGFADASVEVLDVTGLTAADFGLLN